MNGQWSCRVDNASDAVVFSRTFYGNSPVGDVKSPDLV